VLKSSSRNESLRVSPRRLLAAGCFPRLNFLEFGRRRNWRTYNQVIKIIAHKFEYEPNRIELKRGEQVVLELTSQHVTHGFDIAELGLRADLEAGQTTPVRLVPEKTGTFAFHCDNFCGFDHENMSGTITVK
jgi:cytochrome c oxidase subunit II